MGGKTGTTTQQVSIPPDVLARYNSVNAQAQQVAETPFKQYSTDPNAFVAPLTAQQNLGIGNINQYATSAQPGYQAGMDTTGSAINQINAGQNVAQPYYGAATGLTDAAAQQVEMNMNAAQPAYQAGYGAAGQAQNILNQGLGVAQPYFQGAQTFAAGTLPQYQQAAGLAGAAMTPLQQATYAAQPSYQAAQAGTMAAGAGTGQTIGQLGNISQGYNVPNYQAGVQGYMNPYLQNAMGSTAAMMQNQNQQQQNQLQGNAISSGAFGGDRGNVAQAALMGQQNLAMGQTLGQMANTGYQSAAQNYMSGLGQQGALAGQQGAMYGQLGNLSNQYGQLGGQAQQALINAGQAQQQGAANIANIAGQGMGAASQYGALGTAAQNAALQGMPLAQQQATLYGQLGTGAQNAAMQGAQQLGALGAQYGQLGTSAQNAALQGVPLSLAAGAQQGQLGAGAQMAGLQGAQAQIGAGTLGQQTQQAGLTALYNQFLQQQAYPFQTAQFLANIAEGTGALSGSTTTTQQPMGFFSDERLKDGIKRIGETDDGQTIYKYHYKHDPEGKTHIGLLAQEVEKHKPDAVGLAAGFKTVDYDKATKDAESMGGGVLPDGGRQNFDLGGYAASADPTMLAMLAAQGVGQQGSGVVPYATPATSSARSINIPMQVAYNRQLMRPEPAPKMQSGLAEAAQNAQSIAGLASTGSKAYDWAKGNLPDQNKPMDFAGDVPMPTARPAGMLATGGVAGDNLPYEKDETNKLDIPEESPTARLQTPGAPQQQQSGLSQLSQLASLGTAASKLAPMASAAATGIGDALSWLPMLALATGGVAAGRRGYKDGKTVTPDAPPSDTTPKDDATSSEEPTVEAAPAAGVAAGTDQPMSGTSITPTFDNILNISRAAIKKIEGGDYGITGPVTRHKVGDQVIDDVPLGAYGVMRSNVPSWTKEALGKEMTPEDFLANPKAQDAVFDYHFGKNVKSTGNPLDAASIWFTGKTTNEAGNAKDVLGTTNADYQSKFTKYSGLGAAAAPQSDTTTAQGGDKGILGGVGDMFGNMSNETKLSLLSGVFGMLASPSPFLLQAIGHGGLAGVKTYEDLTRLKNESLKNTMGMIQDRFVTTDGQTYTDKWGVLPSLNRAQMGAYVQQMLKQSGVGGTTLPSLPGVSEDLKVPEVTTPGAAQKAVETAKGVTTTSPTTGTPTTGAPTTGAGATTTTKEPPAEEPKDATSAGEGAAHALDFSNAKSELEIKQMILKDNNTWKDVSPMLSAPWLYDQAAKQQELMTQYQQQAARAAGINPAAATTYTAQADKAKAQMDDYRKRADDSLNAASSAAINEFNEMQKKSREPATAVTPSGEKISTSVAAQIKASREGQPVTTEQSPVIAERLKAIAADDNVLREAARKRPDIRQSLDAIAGILEKYSTGRFADTKAEIIGALQGAGVAIPKDIADRVTSLDELVKYANTQTLGQMKQLGNKFTNLELGNISKTVSGAPMTPEANAEIVARAKAILDYDDLYWNDYQDWKHASDKNLNDPFPENNFDKKWIKDHENTIDEIKTKHKHNIAALVDPSQLPNPNDPSKWEDGQLYNWGKGVYRWDADGNRPDGNGKGILRLVRK